jgi:hypothetical protein
VSATIDPGNPNLFVFEPRIVAQTRNDVSGRAG